MNKLSRSHLNLLVCASLLIGTTVALVFGGCGTDDPGTVAGEGAPQSGLLEPPGHAPGEPHLFTECPDGACPREQPAYLFSGEFHEAVVDLRVSGCSEGLDLVWARRYRSRFALPADQTSLGNNWDHSYNIYVRVPEADASASPIVVYDGNARPASFEVDEATGTWSSPGYHREGSFDERGRFVLQFADGGAWVFKSAEDSARRDIRRLAQIIDGNGNIIDLEYDDADRLARVVNPIGQSLDLEYDGTGHIVAVTAQLDAQTRRRVTYEHYQAGDVGGNPYDLARVTLPPIVGTVTGNDFPGGTTTTYTYTTGSGNPALDGNLLTITDSLGRVYLHNTYASSTDPSEFEFDHLVGQVWGDADDAIAIAYVPVTPTADNEHAVRKAWVNDRVGRVTEHFFDERNQLVLLREYTGFAAPGSPTDGVRNRPIGKLRADDPTYFETRYAYNDDGRVTRVVHPRGNVTRSIYEGDLNPDASPRVRGNLREVHREAAACDGEPGTISEYFEYAENLGNEHGETNFVVRAQDPRGNVTVATYDSAGNRTSAEHPEPQVREDMEYDAAGRLTRQRFPEDQHGHRRETIYVYEQHGRRRTTIEDPDGLALTTVSEYDAACNEIRRVDPRGNDVVYVYNQHDQLVRELGPVETCSEACGGGTPHRSYTDRIYDAKMNLVRVDYEARDCDGTLQADDVVSTHYEYDTLDELIATRSELGDGRELVNEFELDANREVLTLRYGAAASGADPFNTLTHVYDERGMLYREIRGAGSQAASTAQHDYDANANETTILAGLEGPVQTTAYTFDCADRLIATVDPMGNRTEQDYDLAGNVVEQRLFGELVDVPGGDQNVLLERTTVTYDAMNRATVTTRDHFNPVTQTPIGDGHATTTTVYDGESRIVLEVDDNGHQTAQEFDHAGRRAKTVDPAGNTTEYAYDLAGNITSHVQTHVASHGDGQQVRVWDYTYDARNNLIAEVDPLGNETHTCYDSLGLATADVDALGNRTLHHYDGAGRLLESHHLLTDDGTGDGALLGAAVVRQVWDDSDRLIGREDPNGNITTYEYDSLNRVVAETFADGGSVRSSYDVHGNIVARRDPNGTVLTHTHDALNRVIEVDVDPGEHVDGDTTFESYAYDGRSLLIRASDDDTEVTRAYDSLNALLSDTQTLALPNAAPASRTVSYLRDGLGNPALTSYPSGRRIARTFDGLRRTQLLSEDAEQLVRFDYLGPDLVRKQVVPLGLRSEYAHDLDRRMLRSRHIMAGGEVLDAREYGYDDAGNKQLDRELTPDGSTGTQQIEHDSLGRTVRSRVTDSLATDRDVSYAFDGAGNRLTVVGDACSGAYSQSPHDAPVHQYTSIPCEVWSHDAAGNLRSTTPTSPHGVKRSFTYDHRNRLIEFAYEEDVIHRFAYDALGRKVHARGPHGQAGRVHYVYDGWNVIEELVEGEPGAAVTYLYADDLDERLEMRRADASWWYLDDELGSTIAVVRRVAADELEVERYAYGDYGEPMIFVDGAAVPTSMAGNSYLYAGSRYLPDGRLYDMRTRHFDPVAGRFISRDQIGIWGDEENLGNGYTYVGNTPDSYTDPTGEYKKPHVKNCHRGARDQIESVLFFADRISKRSRNWFNSEAKRKRVKRKRDWTRNRNDGREWWGKYHNTRFHRIKLNFQKIVRRCAGNVITFKCRTTGRFCGRKTARAWTHSSWHSQIRLCKYDDGGFFDSSGGLLREPRYLGATLVHEIAHNINAIGDKKLNGNDMYSEAESRRLAKRHPSRASWNAANYDNFADTMRRVK